MKKNYLFLILVMLFFGKLCCQEPAVEMTTNMHIGFDFSFEIAAIADNTPIQVDFGDGVLVNKTIHSYTTWITGTLKEVRIVKIYGSGISYLNCSAKDLIYLNVSNATELEYLDCNYNSLTSMDVTNNVNLTSLSVDLNGISNLDLTHNVSLEKLSLISDKLTELNVSNNVLLTELNCSENWLTQIDVTHNPVLEVLECNSQPITNLVLTGNPELVHLSCGSCQLTNLDVSNNILLQDLRCTNNLLDSLDVSNNIALENLMCSNNQIHTLDLTNNSNLRSISCEFNHMAELNLGNMPYLYVLVCRFNEIKELNLSQCPALIEISCNDNMLSEFDISMNDNHARIDCYNNYIPFTKLTVPNTSWEHYGYAPQTLPIISVFSTGEIFDLSDQYNINGNLTHYEWKTNYGSDLEIINDYTIKEGRTIFLRPFPDSVYCEMTNATYPEFSGLPLKTTLMNIKGDIIPLLSMTSSNETGSGISFSLKAATEDSPIKIDYGDGILVFDTIGTNETLFQDTLVGSQTVNIYGQGITLLNCDNNRLISLYISNDTSLLTLSLRNNLFSKLCMENLLKLNSLDCSNNRIDFIGGVYGRNMKSLICNYNKLTFATLPRNFAFYHMYVYAPQKPIDIGKTIALGNELDLSSQYFVLDVFDDPIWSRYTWKTQNGITLSEGIDYTINDGVTVFNTMLEDSVNCEITNSLFPDLSGSDVLRTTFTKLILYDSSENLKNQEPRIYSNNKFIYIDAPSDAYVSIFDINGRLFMNKSVSESLNIIQMQKTGLYFVKWMSRNHSFTQKIFIQ